MQSLAVGETLTETITVTTADGTTGTVTITINGTNDTPTISGEAAGAVKEDGTQEVSGQLDKADVDASDTHTWSANDGGKGQYGTLTVDQSGRWTYVLDNGSDKVQALTDGQKVTDTLTVTVDDGHGGTATETITVEITGTRDAAIITPSKPGDDAGTVQEDKAYTANGKLDVTDKDAGQASFNAQTDAKGEHGSFSIDANGNWTYTLDNTDPKVQALAVGEKLAETFTVTTDDGTQSTVTVTIDGTNDKPELSGKTDGAVTEDDTDTATATGKLDVSDIDTRDTHTWTVGNDGKGQYGTFTVEQNGNWKFELDNESAKVQELAEGQQVTDTFTVTVDDGHGGTATETITVEITGTNDAPTITGTATGKIQEGSTQALTGQLTQHDVDTNDTHTWSLNNDGKGQYGSFTLDQHGNWTYKLDNANTDVKALKDGEHLTETITVTVDDGQGGKATQVIAITVDGTSDGAVITPSKPGDDAGTVEEDATLTASGKLDVIDPDAGEAVFRPQTDFAGQYGTFSIDANGNWRFKLDNNAQAIQQLGAKDHLTEVFTVITADGTNGQVTITINGTNDAPTLSGAVTGAVREDGAQTASGQLDKADIDASDTHTWTVSNDGKGQYGSFTVDGSGKWTYTLDNASDKVQALKDGETVTDTLTVTVDDGHGGTATETITVEITGTRDAAIITPSRPGDDAGTVQEDKVYTANGKLDVTDKDAGQASFTPQTDHQGQYGKFSIDAIGNWTFTLDNDAQAVQQLGAKDHLTEVFTVTTADGTSGKVTITINGANDAPVAADSAASVTEGGRHTFTAAEFNFNDGAEGNSLDSVIITRLPVDGALALNGRPITANTVVPAADLAAGKLVYTPSATGQNASFGFKVRDNGGTADGGRDTSGEYNFVIKTNAFIAGDNDSSGTGAKPPLSGGAGDDVILGDKGGTVTTVEPGKNYSIALVVDTSESMLDPSGTKDMNRMQLTIDALKNLANTLKGHDGIINLALISFQGSSAIRHTVKGLNGDNVGSLIKAIEGLSAKGGTNYADAFWQANRWFNMQPEASKGAPFEKVVYFLTDGDSISMDYAVAQFKLLTDKGATVHAIGIGQGVKEEYLKFFDNSGEMEMGKLTLPGGDVVAPVGQPEIVNTAEELKAALQSGSSKTDPTAVGDDVVKGDAGHDLIFGDVLNTDGDVLDWSAVGGRPADLAQGAGVKALQVFLEMRDGHTPSNGELYQYIKEHHADFNLADDARGGDDTIHGGSGDDIIYGQGGNDTLYGDDGSDILYGGTGDDKLHGGDGNDMLHGGSGDDRLDGGNGSDLLIGGKGDDILTGGDGSDVFKWELGDQGTTAKPSVDTIKDFSLAAASAGGDVLDLRDLLTVGKAGSLAHYLNFHKEGNNTVIDVNTKGELGSQGADQKIVLENVDLTHDGQLNNQAIIDDLLQKGKLNVDLG
ncbi:hypothetical protein LMG26696_02532 [Achromobacter pulmonis]|nr:hypothetical protein LMG26696_02532 [Achromobacter pulmonis]